LVPALIVLAPATALACPVCYQAVDSPLLDAAQLGVFALLGVTVGVLVGFAAFFRRLMKLSAQAQALPSSVARAPRALGPANSEGQS
jgi:hypothetical protein